MRPTPAGCLSLVVLFGLLLLPFFLAEAMFTALADSEPTRLEGRSASGEPTWRAVDRKSSRLVHIEPDSVRCRNVGITAP